MEFRRINGLPPYVFATINDLKAAARRAGRDVIDLGFGNPDLPSPDVAVGKLAEAAHNPRNHRYSASRGIPKLRSADHRPLPAQVRRRARPRDRGGDDHRRQGGLLAPHVGPRRPRATPRWCPRRRTRSTSGVRSSPAPTCARYPLQGPGGVRRRARPRRGVLRRADARLGGVVAQAAASSCSRSRTTRRRPASTSSFMERLVDVRPRARGGAGARLRLRGPRLRRVRAARPSSRCPAPPTSRSRSTR